MIHLLDDLKVTSLSLVLYGLLDYVWFKVSLKHYKKLVADVTGRRAISMFDVGLPAVLAYLIMALCTTFLVVAGEGDGDGDGDRIPRGEERRTRRAEIAWRGLWLSLAMYGIFNLTNMTLFGRNAWTYGVAAMDTLWGIFVVAVVSQAALLIRKR